MSVLLTHLCTVLSATNPKLEAVVGNRRNLLHLSQALLVRREFKHSSETLLLKTWGRKQSGLGYLESLQCQEQICSTGIFVRGRTQNEFPALSPLDAQRLPVFAGGMVFPAPGKSVFNLDCEGWSCLPSLELSNFCAMWAPRYIKSPPQQGWRETLARSLVPRLLYTSRAPSKHSERKVGTKP